MTIQLYKWNGQPVTINRELGKGGEGAVFEILEHNSTVAKLYHKDVPIEKVCKLEEMVKMKTERLLRLSAWPIDILYDGPKGSVKGFLMPQIKNHQDIHVLCGVKSRLDKFPNASWAFIIQTATNLARVFSVMHQHHLVVGDVNERNVVVAEDATVKLIDCDSFQIISQDKQYLCGVAVPFFTPPELQGRKTFKDLVRTPNHDCFGLAVLIFQLLFLGRHPFSGRYLDTDNLPLEKAIQEHRFAYSKKAQSLAVISPPGSLKLEYLPDSVADLFERAFLEDKNRPSAQEWIATLADLSQSLKKCPHNAAHYFFKVLDDCTWCKLESKSNVFLFNVIFSSAWKIQSDEKISIIWKTIESIAPPSSIGNFPSGLIYEHAPSEEVKKLNKNKARYLFFSVAFAIVLSFIVIIDIAEISLSIFASAIMAFLCVLILRTGNVKDIPSLSLRKKRADQEIKNLQQIWDSDNQILLFNAKRAELEKKKIEYDHLAELRQSKMRQLLQNTRERQLLKFLNSFNIDQYIVSGISRGKKATLRSYGIETAADITKTAILNIPGFGPVYLNKLLMWKTSIEQKFKFNPRLGVDPNDQKLVDKEIDIHRIRLENALQKGREELKQISQNAENYKEGLFIKAEKALEEQYQADFDVNIVKKNYSFLIPIVIVFTVLFIGFPLRPFLIKSLGLVDKMPSYISLNNRNNNSVTREKPQPRTTNTFFSEAGKKAKAQKLYEEGVSATKLKKFDEAVRKYEEALTLNSEMPETLHEIGYALYRLNKYKDSILFLQKAIKLNTQNAETYRVLGLALAASGRWEDATQSFQQAISVQPKYPLPYYNLGLSYKKILKYEEAKEALEKAILYDVNFSAAHYELGLIYIEHNEFELAQQEYNSLEKLDSKLAQKLLDKLNN